MGYVDSILHPNEKIVYEGRMHWCVYLGPLFWIGFGGLTYLATGGEPMYRYLGAAMLAYGGVRLIVSAVRVATTNLVITTKRIIGLQGVVSRTSTELMLSKLEGVEIRQGLLGLIFGCGDVAVTGTGSRITVFAMIEQPKEFKRALDHAAIALAK